MADATVHCLLCNGSYDGGRNRTHAGDGHSAKTPDGVDALRAVKAVLDPQGVMNPDVLIPD